MARLESQVALINMVRSTKDVELLCMLCAEEDWTELLVFLNFIPSQIVAGTRYHFTS